MTTPIYTSLIAFSTHPGREADFIAAFAECGMLSRPEAIQGFVSAQLLQQSDDPTEFAVVGLWRSPEAYAAWQKVSQSGAPQVALLALASSVARTGPGRLFRQA